MDASAGVISRMSEILCPKCQGAVVVKNGFTASSGKQNWRCRACGRQFVADPSRHAMNPAEKEIARALLKERVSLRGIARVLKVSPSQVQSFFEAEAEELPEHLNCEHARAGPVIFYAVDVECDELWSFVGRKENKQWVWLALDADTRQIVAFHVGDRGEMGARGLWNALPEGYRLHATFFTDLWEAYRLVIPARQHVPSDKGSGFASYIERFNCTLRQRASRLVRKALSFSKKLENHLAAIKLFICDRSYALRS